MVLTFVVSNKVMYEGKILFAVISDVKTTPHTTRRSDFSGSDFSANNRRERAEAIIRELQQSSRESRSNH